MKRFFAILIITIITASANAQSGLYLSVNPLAALEPQAAYGMAVGYAFNDQVDISTEYSRLTKPTWTDEGKYTNIKGFRSVTTMKLTTSTDEYKRVRNFVAAEVRVRQFSFDDMQDFTNNSTHAVTSNFTFKNNTKTIGLAALVGKQREIGYSGRFVMEFTAGIGVRHTTVNRENTPMNSTIVPVETGFGEMPNYRDQQTSVYFPLAIRVIMKL
jgi:hypothetical protein